MRKKSSPTEYFFIQKNGRGEITRRKCLFMFQTKCLFLRSNIFEGFFKNNWISSEPGVTLFRDKRSVLISLKDNRKHIKTLDFYDLNEYWRCSKKVITMKFYSKYYRRFHKRLTSPRVSHTFVVTIFSPIRKKNLKKKYFGLQNIWKLNLRLDSQ